MALDAYSPCPCGSGKKFKWCCQPFYSQIERAFALDANGQHEAAEAALEQLTQQFPDNPEVWGRRAELLWDHQKHEQAEAALDKALELSPRWAKGYMYRASFRQEEHEFDGALHLYRKAAALCDPAATDLLAGVHIGIAQCEIVRQRPFAARAALELALRLQPANSVAHDLENRYFGVESPFPSSLRRRYALKPLPATAPPALKQAWQQALAGGQSGRLTDALKAFEKLTQEHPGERAALYNLALVRAWLGDNAGAIAALDHYVALEDDEAEAAGAWALADALRQAKDLVDQSDWVELCAAYRFQDPQRIVEYLRQETRLADVQQQQGVVAGTLLDRDMPPPSDSLALFEVPRMAAHVVIFNDHLILTHKNPQQLAKAQARVEQHLGPVLTPVPKEPRTLTFRQIVDYLLSIRMPPLGDEAAQRIINGALEQTFEEEWANRPLKALGRRTPLEAMACAPMRPRVMGLVKLLEEVTGSNLPFPYDFNKLRQKLEAVALDPAAKPPPLMELDFPSLSWKPKKPLSECGVEELNALPIEEMNEADLHQALQAAERLQHPRLICSFAEALLEREALPGPDRYPLYQALIQAALGENDLAAAESWINAGMKIDCEQNAGARRNDYELARAKVYLSAGQPKQAYDVFVKLIQRQPANLDYLGAAAEAMLKAGMRPQAAQFADNGLANARAKGDKSRVGYFQELLAAAKRG